MVVSAIAIVPGALYSVAIPALTSARSPESPVKVMTMPTPGFAAQAVAAHRCMAVCSEEDIKKSNVEIKAHEKLRVSLERNVNSLKSRNSTLENKTQVLQVTVFI